MKSTHLMAIGVILMLAEIITPRVAPALAVSLGIILILCFVVGLLMLVVGAIRWAFERKKI